MWHNLTSLVEIGLSDLPKFGDARCRRFRQACNGHKMGKRTQRNLTTKVRYFVFYDFTTLNWAKSFMKLPQFAIFKYLKDLKMFRRPCSWFGLIPRSWNFSKIANSLGFSPRPTSQAIVPFACITSLFCEQPSELDSSKKSAKFNSPWSVHCPLQYTNFTRPLLSNE